MNSQDLYNLSEAYLDVYQLDEISKELADRVVLARYARTVAAANRKSRAHTPENVIATVRAAEKEERARGLRLGVWERRAAQTEQVDLYDIILSHLLDEGYADTFEAAEAIMVSMSEDWRESICEELTGERRKRALKKRTPLSKQVASAKEGSSVTQNADKNMPTRRGGSSGLKRNPNRWGKPGPIDPGPATLNRYEKDRGSGNKAARRAGKKVKDNEDRHYWNDDSPDF